MNNKKVFYFALAVLVLTLSFSAEAQQQAEIPVEQLAPNVLARADRVIR
jgi:cell division protein FtsL